jgi:SAM-dependent methyltransferase
MSYVDEAKKDAERRYPDALGDAGRQWLRTKPFVHAPRETARHLIDFGYILQLLELEAGTSLCELGCGPGWICLLASRHGVDVVGYDISSGMIEVAQQRAVSENLEADFRVGDVENLDLKPHFDACLTYDALHHSRRPERVIATAYRALVPGGRLLVVEPNWKQRFEGRRASASYGTTELGHSPRQLKRMIRGAGFGEIERFHNNRKRLYSNAVTETVLHLLEPWMYRTLAPFWTQIWLRARKPAYPE